MERAWKHPNRASASFACNCVGPQNGQPKCPCMMRGVIIRDGRYIEPERDLGPAGPATKTVYHGAWPRDDEDAA